MANVKISALTSASTPLAGTEVLPIVQSSATVKVAVADLTAGRAISALSLNSLTVGLGAGSVATNTAVGVSALAANTTGSNNTAIGSQSLLSNTTASYSTAVGYQAGYNSTGGFLTAVGYQAGYSSTGNTVDAFGYQAAQDTTTGTFITAIGTWSLQKNTTGGQNVGVGREALNNNTTGSYNTAIGMQALDSNTTAINNTALGYQASYTSAAASGMVSIGALANYSNVTSGNTYSTAVGFQAAKGGSGAINYNDVSVGAFALLNITSGNSNVAIGYSCGSNLTTGGSNTYVGTNAQPSSAGVSNEVILGGLTGKGASTAYIAGASGVYNQGNTSTWATTSDERLKKNIVDNNIGLEKITAIQVRNFEYRTEAEVTDLPAHSVIKKDGVQLGVIAQELQAVLPECVTEQSTGVLSVDVDNLTWYLVNAIKELKAEIDQLKGNV
jgi:hypothetical protein